MEAKTGRGRKECRYEEGNRRQKNSALARVEGRNNIKHTYPKAGRFRKGCPAKAWIKQWCKGSQKKCVQKKSTAAVEGGVHIAVAMASALRPTAFAAPSRSDTASHSGPPDESPPGAPHPRHACQKWTGPGGSKGAPAPSGAEMFWVFDSGFWYLESIAFAMRWQCVCIAFARCFRWEYRT
jgi:hypothetical protein